MPMLALLLVSGGVVMIAGMFVLQVRTTMPDSALMGPHHVTNMQMLLVICRVCSWLVWRLAHVWQRAQNQPEDPRCGEGAPHVSDHDADGQRGEM